MYIYSRSMHEFRRTYIHMGQVVVYYSVCRIRGGGVPAPGAPLVPTPLSCLQV